MIPELKIFMENVEVAIKERVLKEQKPKYQLLVEHGFTESHLSNYLRGRRDNPSLKTLVKLAQLGGVEEFWTLFKEEK